MLKFKRLPTRYTPIGWWGTLAIVLWNIFLAGFIVLGIIGVGVFISYQWGRPWSDIYVAFLLAFAVLCLIVTAIWDCQNYRKKK